MRNAISFLVDLRRQSKAFSICEAAAKVGCTEMTVRNFEAGRNTNGELFHFYLVRLMHVSDEMADNIIKMLMEGK